MAKKPEALEKTTASLFDSIDELKKNEQVEQEIVSHGVSAWSVVSLVLAVLAFLAFVHVAFVVFAVLSAICAIFAFCAIARSGGEVAGKKIACLGLALAIACGIGGPVRKAVYRMEFDRQAAQFCEEWFKNVQSGDVVALRQMINPYWKRATIMNHEDEVNYFVREKAGEDEAHYGTHSFLSNPTLLTLYTLGDKAHHSFYVSTTTWLTNSTESTERMYAITVDPDPEAGRPEKQTFFLRLVCNRVLNLTEEGERLIGWSTIVSELTPVELDKDGKPIWTPVER